MVKKPGGAAAQAPNKAAKKTSTDEATPGRLKQIRMVAGVIRKSNRWALPIVFGVGIGVIALFVLIGLLVGAVSLLVPSVCCSGLPAP